MSVRAVDNFCCIVSITIQKTSRWSSCWITREIQFVANIRFTRSKTVNQRTRHIRRINGTLCITTIHAAESRCRTSIAIGFIVYITQTVTALNTAFIPSYKATTILTIHMHITLSRTITDNTAIIAYKSATIVIRMLVVRTRYAARRMAILYQTRVSTYQTTCIVLHTMCSTRSGAITYHAI